MHLMLAPFGGSGSGVGGGGAHFLFVVTKKLKGPWWKSANLKNVVAK